MHARGLRKEALCPYCSAAPKDDNHLLWHCAAWQHLREQHKHAVLLEAHAIGLSPSHMATWPPCLRICGLLPSHLSEGQPKGLVHSFMITYHTMVLSILMAQAQRKDVQLFDKPAKPSHMVTYPFMQLCGPLVRQATEAHIQIAKTPDREWRWDRPVKK